MRRRRVARVTVLLLPALPRRCVLALPFGLAAALEPPPPLCELNVAFGAASAAGEWPTSHAALWLFNNRADVNFSSWQAVWTLAEADTLLSDTVTGAILINPGGPGGQPCRAINTADNAPLLSGRGGRWFGYEFQSTAAPSLRAPSRLAVNGLGCVRTSALATDAAGEALLACDAATLTGCGFVWFCCGDASRAALALVAPAAAPSVEVEALPGEPLEVVASAAAQQRASAARDATRRRTTAAATGAALGAAALAAAAGVAASRRRRARRRSATASRLAAWEEEAGEAAVANGDVDDHGAGSERRAEPAAARHVTFATTHGSSADSSAPLWRTMSLSPPPPRAAPQPHPLHADGGASRRGAAPSGDAWSSGAARAWRELVGFNAWATLGSGSASSAQSSLRSAVALTRRASSSASLASIGTAALPPHPAAGDASAVPEVDMDRDVTLEELIGTGAFGAVYRGRWRRGGGGAPVPVAVKMLHFGSAGDAAELASFTAEVAVLARLSHPRIVRLLGACLAPPRVCMLEELQGGSLHAFMHGPAGRRFTYRETLALAEDIADAMDYLHPGVVHRDLKAQNVLLDTQWRAKVCDFGIAKLKSNTYLSTKHVQAGTPAYMAPELFAGGNISEKIDLWSFGTLLWEMYTGEIPWRTLVTPVQVIFAVAVQHARLPLPAGCPPALSALIDECWRRAPEERPSFAQVLPRLRSMRAEVGGFVETGEDMAHRTI